MAIALESGARAEEPRRVELTWIADPSCPDHDAVVRQVEQLVRGAPPKEIVVARAAVVHDSAWRVRLETGSGEHAGSREIEAESCAQLADATAVILALMIDPSAALRKTGPAAPPATPVAVTAPPRVEPPPVGVLGAPRPPSPEPRLVRVVVAASALADIGSLPGVAPGVGISAGVLPGAFWVTGDFAYFPAQRGQLATRPKAGGDVTLLAAALVGCRTVLTLGRIAGAPCLGLELDGARGEGFGVSSPRSGWTAWGAALAYGRVEAAIVEPVSAEVRIGAAIPFGRPLFYFDQLGAVYRPSAASLRLAVGVVAKF
ncbi:MAG: hypothetical protein QM820_40670 [Minicystis sp.]